MNIPTTPELAESTLAPPPAAPRIIDDSVPDPAAEATREAAFDAAPSWHGRPLLPFSSSRKSLFLQHRLAMGAPELSKCMRDLDAFFADAVRLIFLCSYAPEAPLPIPEETLAALAADPRHRHNPAAIQAATEAMYADWQARGNCWSRLRADPHALQTAIDAFADRAILPGEEHLATMLGYRIYADSLTNRHEPAPAPRASADELGN